MTSDLAQWRHRGTFGFSSTNRAQQQDPYKPDYGTSLFLSALQFAVCMQKLTKLLKKGLLSSAFCPYLVLMPEPPAPSDRTCGIPALAAAVMVMASPPALTAPTATDAIVAAHNVHSSVKCTTDNEGISWMQFWRNPRLEHLAGLPGAPVGVVRRRRLWGASMPPDDVGMAVVCWVIGWMMCDLYSTTIWKKKGKILVAWHFYRKGISSVVVKNESMMENSHVKVVPQRVTDSQVGTNSQIGTLFPVLKVCRIWFWTLVRLIRISTYCRIFWLSHWRPIVWWPNTVL